MPVDLDLLLSELRLVGPMQSADLLQAIVDPPVLERTVDGASTLEVTVTDVRRVLLRSGMFDARSWAVVDGLTFELVGVRKSGNRLTLTFEDAIAAGLRRHRQPDSAPAGSTSRAEWVRRLAGRAGVTVLVDPALERTATEVLSVESPDGDAWKSTGEAAEPVGARRFSDGDRLLVGGDEWLAGLVTPWRVAERTGPVHFIDVEMDVGRPASAASMDVDARRWAVMPGRQVELTGMGPADGLWLTASFRRRLTRRRAQVGLTRRRLVLPEPPPQSIESEIGPGANAPGVDRALALSGIRESGPDGAGASGWAWPTYDKRITSGFGPRRSPGVIGSKNHAGIDVGVRTGTKVFAAKAGRVAHAGSASGYGTAVYLDHGGGVSSRYAHLSRLLVQVGQTVTSGSEIGLSGATGNVTGPHLHFEIRVGGAAHNPLNYLPR